MSYVIQAVLSNPRRPECDQITIPFPIPVDQYDKTIEMLQAIDLGFSVNRDCTVDEVNSRYNVLNTLVGTLVNIDQLDYLAKRLDGFCSGEVSQFEAMVYKLGLNDITDIINLTYCCQQATVITNFSDLEAVGRSHFMNLNGGSATMEELENLDGVETACLLIDGGGGVMTPDISSPHIPMTAISWYWRLHRNVVWQRGKIRNTCTSPQQSTKLKEPCSGLVSPGCMMLRYASTGMKCRKRLWMRRNWTT